MKAFLQYLSVTDISLIINLFKHIQNFKLFIMVPETFEYKFESVATLYLIQEKVYILFNYLYFYYFIMYDFFPKDE